MPRDMASLLSMPMTPSPPSEDVNASGQAQAGSGSLQQLMARGNAPAGAGGAPGGAPLTMDHAFAAIRHLTVFEHKWAQLGRTDGIGKRNIRPEMVEMAADLMGDGYVTLPQSMSLLKSFPDDPLQQRQWVEQHRKNDERALITVMQQIDQAAPFRPPEMIAKAANTGKADNHAKLIGDIAGRLSGKPR